MKPYIQYVKKAIMSDGEEAPFTLEKNYEINCAFSLEGVTHISVGNDKGEFHHFDIEEDWFSQSFVVCGDLDSVWEEV